MPLLGQRALVTGASGAIGRAIAACLAAEAATICMVGRRLDALRAVAESVAGPSNKAFCIEADLANDGDIARLASWVRNEFGGLDILVHCAGVIAVGPVECTPVSKFDAQYRTNVRAPYLLTQALLPMLKRARGQVVFMNSSVGLAARTGVAQYAATKHGLKALADSLRQEVNGYGVRVLSVFLGRTASEMQRAVHEAEGRRYRPEQLAQPEDVASIVIAALRLARTAEVTEISLRPLMRPQQDASPEVQHKMVSLGADHK